MGQTRVAVIDPFRMRQVFRNLLENCVGRMPRPGRDYDPLLSADELDGSPAMRISVSDNGPGLPARAETKGVRGVLHDQDERDRPGPGDLPADHRGPRGPDQSSAMARVRGAEFILIFPKGKP